MQAKGKSDLSEDKAGEVQGSSGILGPKRRSKSLAGGDELWVPGPEMRRFYWYLEQKRAKGKSDLSEDKSERGSRI